MGKTAALILAAGGSSRFGPPKQIAQFRGCSLVRHALLAASGAGCDPILVVVGAHAAQIRLRLDGSPAEIVMNTRWRDGIASSICAGIGQLGANEAITAAILLACDQPLVSAEILQALQQRHAATRKPIIASSYSDTVGIPALFARSCFPDLLALQGDQGAKSFILAHASEVATIDFPEGAIDIDTLADHRRLSERG